MPLSQIKVMIKLLAETGLIISVEQSNNIQIWGIQVCQGQHGLISIK